MSAKKKSRREWLSKFTCSFIAYMENGRNIVFCDGEHAVSLWLYDKGPEQLRLMAEVLTEAAQALEEIRASEKDDE